MATIDLQCAGYPGHGGHQPAGLSGQQSGRVGRIQLGELLAAPVLRARVAEVQDVPLFSGSSVGMSGRAQPRAVCCYDGNEAGKSFTSLRTGSLRETSVAKTIVRCARHSSRAAVAARRAAHGKIVRMWYVAPTTPPSPIPLLPWLRLSSIVSNAIRAAGSQSAQAGLCLRFTRAGTGAGAVKSVARRRELHSHC